MNAPKARSILCDLRGEIGWLCLAIVRTAHIMAAAATRIAQILAQAGPSFTVRVERRRENETLIPEDRQHVQKMHKLSCFKK